MSAEDFNEDRFRKLLDLYINAEMAEENLQEFEEYLKEEKYRDIYIKLVHQDSVLYQLFEKVEIEEKPPVSIPFIFKVVAAAIIIITPLLIYFTGTKKEVDEFEAFTVSNTINCTWNRDVSENDNSIQLTTGVAKLNFQDGSAVVIEAPVTFKQVNSNTIYLEEGNIFIKGKPNFTVLTEKDKIVDISTEFGVSIDRDTRIQVHKGRVSLSNESINKVDLTEGKAVISGEQSVNEVDFINSYFLRDIPNKPAKAKMAPNAFFPGTVPYNINSFNSYLLLKLEEEISIDGNTQEWDSSGVFSSSCRPPFDQSHSIKGQIKYNEKGIFTALTVRDPGPMKNKLPVNQQNCWNAGSQQLWFAKGNEKVCLTLLYSAISEKSYLFKTINDDKMNPVANGSFEGKHLQISDSEYSLEYFIPWETLGFKINKNDKISFHLTSHWGDETGKYWNGFLEEFQNYEYFNFDQKNIDSWGYAEIK